MRRAGMDIDAGEVVRVLRHDARNQRYLRFVQLMRNAIDADRKKSRIRENDFIGIRRRWIALECRLHIRRQRRAKLRNRAEKLLHDRFRRRIARRAFRAAARRLMPNRRPNLLKKFVVNDRKQFTDVIRQHRRREILFAKIPRENQLANEFQNLNDRIAVRQIAGINVPRVGISLITVDNRLNERIERLAGGSHRFPKEDTVDDARRLGRRGHRSLQTGFSPSTSLL